MGSRSRKLLDVAAATAAPRLRAGSAHRRQAGRHVSRAPRRPSRGHDSWRTGWQDLNCDTSCYRCLRSYRNKIEHRLLDRKLGEQLLRHALFGGYPDYPADRTESSLALLYGDLARHMSDQFSAVRNVRRRVGTREIVVPIISRNSNGAETWIDLSSPVAPDVAVSADLRAVSSSATARLQCVDDLLVRRNLPAAVQQVLDAVL